jgi:hypothetical protein
MYRATLLKLILLRYIFAAQKMYADLEGAFVNEMFAG